MPKLDAQLAHEIIQASGKTASEIAKVLPMLGIAAIQVAENARGAKRRIDDIEGAFREVSQLVGDYVKTLRTAVQAAEGRAVTMPNGGDSRGPPQEETTEE